MFEHRLRGQSYIHDRGVNYTRLRSRSPPRRMHGRAPTEEAQQRERESGSEREADACADTAAWGVLP